MIAISRHDVIGSTYSDADFQNANSGYLISLWDANYNFIGKWKYDFHSVTENWWGSNQSPSYKYDTGKLQRR